MDIEETRIGILGHVDSGKCFEKGTLIKMHNGEIKTIESIEIHDTVMGDDNKPRTVIEKTTGIGKLYRITQESGIDYVVNGYHILSLYFDNNGLTKEEEKIYKKYLANFKFSIHWSRYFDISIKDYLEIRDKIIRKRLLGYNINGNKSLITVTELDDEGMYYGISLHPSSRNLRFQLSDGTIVHNSTLTGVITKRDKNGDVQLDDGRGKMRSKIMKHPHELKTGRTSDVVQHYHREITQINIDEQIHNCEKIKVFIDLAGHEKYFRVTLNGITKCSIHWCCLVVAANMGVLRMTREHLSVALLFNLPIFIVLTKLDISPPNITKSTCEDLQKIFKLIPKERKRKLYFINNQEKWEKYKKIMKKDDFSPLQHVPVFAISSVTGQNVNSVIEFVDTTYPYIPIENKMITQYSNVQYIIDNTYQIPGVGIVVSGVLMNGTIRKNDILALGPFHNYFIMVIVRSIHNNFRESIDELHQGLSGCLNIKPVANKTNLKRHMIRRGIKLLSEPRLYWKFKAKIKILQHQTTISKGYQPFLHCGNISQTCRIENIDGKECLRLGDEAEVLFTFMHRPEFIKEGEKLVFRDGMTKGVGYVLELFSDNNFNKK